MDVWMCVIKREPIKQLLCAPNGFDEERRIDESNFQLTLLVSPKIDVTETTVQNERFLFLTPQNIDFIVIGSCIRHSLHWDDKWVVNGWNVRGHSFMKRIRHRIYDSMNNPPATHLIPFLTYQRGLYLWIWGCAVVKETPFVVVFALFTWGRPKLQQIEFGWSAPRKFRTSLRPFGRDESTRRKISSTKDVSHFEPVRSCSFRVVGKYLDVHFGRIKKLDQPFFLIVYLVTGRELLLLQESQYESSLSIFGSELIDLWDWSKSTWGEKSFVWTKSF